jgi:copper transport protein
MGWSLGLSMVGMVMVAITAGLPFKGAVRTIAGAGAAVAPLGFALTGHTRTMVPAWAGMVADLAHLAAAAIWLGGLVALIGILRRRRAAGDVIGSGEAVAGFSGLAAVALVGVAMSGAAMATIVVGGSGSAHVDHLRPPAHGQGGVGGVGGRGRGLESPSAGSGVGP